MLEEQPRPTGGARPTVRSIQRARVPKGTESHPELAEQEEQPRCRDRGLAVLEEQPRPTESCGARESESVTARLGESQEAEGKPRWSSAKLSEPIKSEMPRWSPATPGELIRCERKLRWSPVKLGEPIKSEMTTGDAWWSEKSTKEAWRRRNPRENKETLNF